MLQRTCLVLIVMSMFGLTTGATTQARTVASPAALALRASDLPAGFVQTKSSLVGNAASATSDHVSLARLRHDGRIISYESAFTASRHTGFFGLLQTVVAMKTAGGARQEYGWEVAPVRESVMRHPANAHLLAFGSLGDQRFGFRTGEMHGSQRLIDYGVMFQRGSYWVLLLVFAYPGPDRSAQVKAWAGTIDRRIQSAPPVH